MTKKYSQDEIKIAIVQTDIIWENTEANLRKIKEYTKYAKELGGEIVVFPEAMFSGFSMNISKISVDINGPEIEKIKQLSIEEDIAIITSFFVKIPQKQGTKTYNYYNRIYFFYPDGSTAHQDKRHLFRPAGESKQLFPAKERNIISYKGFNILMIACYDLRFPVWCRNCENEYDILIDIANWPTPRHNVWHTLLRARAMENLVYVVGVNRIGTDESQLDYSGGSAIIDPRGNTLVEISNKIENIALATIEKEPMERLRNKFPVWRDADNFILDPKSPYPTR